MSPDGKKLAVYSTVDYGSQGKIAVLDIGEDGKLSGGQVSSVSSGIKGLAFSSDGMSLNALIDENGTKSLVLLNIKSDFNVEQGQVLNADLGNSVFLSSSQNGDLLITGDSTYLYSAGLKGTFGQSLNFGSIIHISDVEMDAADSWGNATVTVDSSSNKGIYLFDKDGYTTTDNNLITDSTGKTLASFTSQAGKLIVAFKEGTTAQQAKDIISGFSIQINEGQAGKVTLSISVSDGQKISDTSILEYDLTPNTPPTVTHEGEWNSKFDTAGAEVAVFPEVKLSSGEAGQGIESLKISISDVSNINDSTEYLIVDGQKIYLDSKNHQPIIGDSGLVITYSISSDGNAVISIASKDGITADLLQNILSKVVYGNTAEVGKDSLGLRGTRVFSISEIKDNGGTYQDGNDTAKPDLNSTITLELNSAPDISVEGDGKNSGIYIVDGKIEGFSAYPKDIKFTADGKFVIVSATDNGNVFIGDTKIFVFSRDASTGQLTIVATVDSSSVSEIGDYIKKVSSISLAPDGKTVYFGASAPMGEATSYQILAAEIDDKGNLSNFRSAISENGDASLKLDYYPNDFCYKTVDGKQYLYVADGETWNKTLANSAKVYGKTVNVFEVQSDGSLKFIQSESVGRPVGIVLLNNQLVVCENSTNSIVFYNIGQDGKISLSQDAIHLVDDSNDTADPYDVKVSPDGKHLYVLTQIKESITTKILVYDFDSDNNEWKQSQAVNVKDLTVGWQPNGMSFELSSDGKTILVGAAGSIPSVVYSVNSDGTLVQSGTVKYTDGGSVFGFTLAFSPDGKNFYYGSSYLGSGLVVTSPLTNISYIDGGYANVGAGLALSDIDNDNGGNYKDTTLIFSRDNASDEDQWSFLKSQDYQLSADGQSIVDKSGKSIATWSVDDKGSLTLQFTAEVDKDTANAVIKRVTFASTENLVGPTRFHVTVNDHGEDGKSDEVTFAVSQGNMSLVNPDKDTALSYDENAGVQLFPEAVITAPDAGMEGATLTITADDSGASFEVVAQSGFTFDKDSHELKSGNSVIGSYTEQNGVLTITFNNTAKLADVNGVLQHLVYKGKITAGQDAKFSIEYKDVGGATATLTDAATVHANAAPEFNDKYKDESFKIYPGAENLKFPLPADLFIDNEDASADLKWTVDESTLPKGLEFNADTRTLEGNVPADGKSYTVKVTVTDKQGLTVTKEITFDVSKDANQAPAVVPGASLDEQPTAGKEFNGSVAGFFKDPNDGDTLTYKLADGAKLPEGLTLAEDGTIKGTTNFAGDFPVKVIAIDSQGLESQPADIVLSIANNAPELNQGAGTQTITAGVGQTIDLSGVFSDKDVGQTEQKLSFEVADIDNLPDWLSFKDGVLSITKQPPAPLTDVQITVICKDGVTNADGTPVQTDPTPITIHVVNQAPELTDASGELPLIVNGDTPKFNLGDYFTDPDADKGQKLTYTVTDSEKHPLPKGLEITTDKDGNAVITGSTKDTAPGKYTFTVEATDGYDTITKEFTVEVRGNSLPIMVPAWVDGGSEIQPGSFHVTVGVPVQVDLGNVIVDPDGDTVSIKSVEGLPEGLTFKDGVISGTVSTFVDSTIVITASDGHGTDVVFTLSFHSDTAPFTVPVTQFQHAPLYDPTAANELEEDLLMPVAPASDLPDASIDLAGSSTPFATSQGLSMAMAALQASEPGSKGLSGAALLSAAQVAHSVQHGDVAQPLHGMDQTGKAAPVRAGSSMTLPTQGDKGTPVDEFLWKGSSVILDGTSTPDGAPVAPSSAAPAQVSMAGKPALTEQVHERSAYGDEQPSAKA